MFLFLHTLILAYFSLISSIHEGMHLNEKPNPTLLTVSTFSWKDCGSKSDPIKLTSLSVSPDPIIIPGQLSLGFNFTTTKAVTSPVSLSLVIKKKISFVWIKIPCEDHVGSCTYKDACSIIPPTCPEAFIHNKIPCKCPVKSGTYFLPLSPTINISGSAIPHWLESGQYDVRAQLKDKSGTELFCIDLIAKLKAK